MSNRAVQADAGVLNAARSTTYKDRVEERYHFPSRYLGTARSLLGKWIVYYEPRRPKSGRQAYFVAAELMAIEADPVMDGHFYARMRNYVPFAAPVPLQRTGGDYFESSASATSARGFTQNSIRAIRLGDFDSILAAGMARLLDPANTRLLDLDNPDLKGDIAVLRDAPPERRVRTMLVNRPVREASFRVNVRDAYDNTCAVTGLRITNGGGRPEVEAAHIQAVEHGGPDCVRNGIALSKTVHWMFDRGLIGIRDDYSLIVSHNKVPEPLRGLFGMRQDLIHLPVDPSLRPDPHYLKLHRERHCL